MNDEEYDEDDDGSDDFDYDNFVEENFGSNLTSSQLSPLWRFVAVTLLMILGGFFLLQIVAMF